MSLEAMSWVYTRAPIPAKTRKGEPSPGVLAAVLLCLADGYSEETGLAFRGIRNIAGRTRHDERTVRAAMRALEAYGLIRAAEDQSVVAAKVKRADQRPVGYELMLHLDDGGEHLHDGDSAKPGGRAVPPRPTTGGASGPPVNGTGGRAAPRRGGERSDTGGRAALRTQEELKKELKKEPLRPPVVSENSLAPREATQTQGRTSQLTQILDPEGELQPPPPEHTEPTPDHPGGTSHSAEAHHITAHWGRMQKQTPPGTLLAAVARSVQGCLDSGYLPPQIVAGLDAWDTSTVAAPSQIPAFVHKAVNGRTPVRDGFNHFGDTSRDGFSPSTADLRAAQAQALKRRPSTSAWPTTPLELT